MRILQICNKPPLPKIDGGCVAISHISEGFINHKDVTLLKILTVETYKHPFIIEYYPEEFIKKTNIEAVYIDTRVNFVDAYSSFITSDSYNVIRFFSPTFEKRLIEILQEQEFDIIHLESIFLTPYLHTIRRLSKAKVVLRAHNIEHLLWSQWEKEKNILKRYYLKHLFNKLRKYEKAVLNNVDAVVAISPTDEEIIKELITKPVHTTPVGVDVTQKFSNSIEPKYKVFHIGAMDWLPNEQGINWFIEKVWDKVLKRNPKMELHLAGKNMKKEDYHLPQKRIYCHGETPNANDFISMHDIMIVPLKIGSGIRIKILEAMSFGKVVVSSKVGISGINAKQNKDYLEANNSIEFAERIIEASSADVYNYIGQSAQNFVKDNYEKTTIINKLVEFYKSLLIK